MKKLLLIPVLAGAALLVQPNNADAGFSISFSFGSNGYTPYYQNYPVTFRPGYYGPARIIVVNGRRHWLRPYNEYRLAQRQRYAWRQARARAHYRHQHAHNHRGHHHNRHANNHRGHNHRH